MATFHKITWQEFEQIKKILETYSTMDLVSAEQKEILSKLIEKCQAPSKMQKVSIETISQNEMQKIVAIVDMWPTLSIQETASKDNKLLSTKLQKSYYKEYNVKALHS